MHRHVGKVFRRINQVDCIESLKVAYESNINIFKEIRYFLLFNPNFGFILHWALILLTLSNFSFLLIRHSFSRTFIIPLCSFFSKIALHVCLNFIFNHSLSLLCITLHMKFVWTSNKVDMHSCQKKENESSGKAMSNWQKTEVG